MLLLVFVIFCFLFIIVCCCGVLSDGSPCNIFRVSEALLGYGIVAPLRKRVATEYAPYRKDETDEKAAFSDAVGHSMVDYLKDYANKYYTDLEFSEKAKKYDYARPFTKESLLYREIFEKYYPENAQMIKDFWMPNKSWRGCDVNDPSARVLSNYGASGI